MKYRDAGVDPKRASEVLGRFRRAIDATHRDGALEGIGGFCGVIRAPAAGGFLVATADGVGTKVLLARELGRDREVARDIVHHCVNDCIASGASPLFFLDYIAFDRLRPPLLSALLEGMTEACARLGVTLLGGETAEMPGVYRDEAYDLAGFLVGFAREEDRLRPERVVAGDAVIGLPAAGLHTNGFSLARKIVHERQLDLGETYPGLDAPLGELLLAEHRCYLCVVRGLRERFDVRALAHITGDGLPGNLPRALPEGMRARLERRRWPASPLIAFLRERGDVSEAEASATWNDGIGMAVILPAEQSERALSWLADANGGGWCIGSVEAGEKGVLFE